MAKLTLPTIAESFKVAKDPDAATDRQIAVAADTLISWGRIEEAEKLLDRLRDKPAFAADIRRLEAVAHQMRRSGILTDLEALDHQGIEIGRDEAFTARHPGGSKHVVIVFTAVDPRFWLSLMMLHAYLKRLGTHVIYLVDFRMLVFLDGIRSARGYDGLLDMLRATTRDLGAEHVHILAICGGGFAGLRYGMDLKADSFLGMSIRSNLADHSPIPVGGFFKRPELRAAAPKMMIDLKPFLIASGYPKRIMLYSGAANAVDPHHANHLADMPNVETTYIRDHATHDVISTLIGKGVFEQVLRRMVDPAVPRPEMH